MIFANAISAVMTMFCIGVLGYTLRRKGFVADEVARATPRFLTIIVLPPFLFRATVNTFGREQLLSLFAGSLVPIASIFLCYGVAWAITRLCNIDPKKRNTFIVAFSSSNTMNIGLPMALALFGEAALPFVLLYFFASVTSFWTVGNYLLAKDGEKGPAKICSLNTIRQIFSPPFIGFLLGVLMVLADVRLPIFLDKALGYVGDMTVGIAVMYIGILLGDIRFADVHFDRDVMLVFFGRLVISPLSIIGIAMFFPLPEMMLQVFVIQASLPVMMNVAILSGYYNGQVKYAALLVSATTMASLVSVPLWVVLSGFLLP